MVVVSLGTKGISASWTDGGNPIKPPPKGLEPIGDSGWYKSPDDLLPGDRLYCEYNPGSPVCGGNPFTNQGVGIDAEINVDPCGVSARLSGAIAFVKVPEIQLTYRKAGACRREYEAPPPVVEPPTSPGIDYDPPKAQIPQGYGDDEEVLVVMTVQYWGYEYFYSQRFGGWGEYTYTIANTASNPQYPSKLLTTYINYPIPQPASSSSHHTYLAVGTASPIYTQERGVGSGTDRSESDVAIDSRQPYNRDRFGRILGYKSGGDPSALEIIEGRFGSIFANFKDEITGRSETSYITTSPDGQTSYNNRTVDIMQLCIAYVIRKPHDNSKNPPFLLPQPRQCDCMQCCFSAPSSQQSNNDSCCKEVLEIVKRIDKNLGTYPGKVTIFDSNEDSEGAQSKVIEFATVAQAFTRSIERIEKISKIIGIDLLPVTVPKTIVEPINDNFFKVAWDFITPDATEKIENLFEWHVWNLKQMSALIGDFQRYVEIEDKTETITKEDGTQETKTTTKKIALPDVATALVEIVRNQIVLHREMGLTLDVCMKTLVSSCNTKQEVAKVFAELSEIVDWLDYPTREKSLEVPIQISIPPEGASDADKEDIYKFLQPGKTVIKYNDWDGTNSFKDFMIHLATLMSRNARG